MTPQELKNSILQLAIQGKLVEQRRSEGTAEELYKQIQAEKQALIKAGKIKKEKPLPEITEDEIPFEIPESWMWVRLSDLCSIVTGKRDANYGAPDGEYFFFTCAKEPIKCSSFSFSGESILLAGNGDIGNISYYWGQFEAYQRTYVLQPYIENSYLTYLFYHLQCNWVQYNRGMVFGTAIPYIRLGNVQNYPIALPPLAEQKRIVAKIEELLPLIERYEKAWSRLEDFNKRFPGDMQKSILQMAIQGKLVEQRPEEGTGEELYRQIQAEKQALIKAGKIKKEKPLPEITEDEVPFEIPESWKWCYVGDLFQHNTGKALNSSDKSGTPMTYITTSNLYWNRFELEKLKEMPFTESEVEKCTVQKGDLLVCEGGDYGRSAIWPYECPMRIQNHIHRLKAYGAISVRFFYYCFYLYKNAGMIAGKGIAIQGLSSNALHSLKMPLPPLAEQKRIVARLEELLPLCERLK
ncbi:MAG: hypothetical protein E7426_05140 [Ruminococcaceae bacterium]|nr:hypothetical protein [Oscillospiraceae bacterium]